jgi:hypothetical protein
MDIQLNPIFVFLILFLAALAMMFRSVFILTKLQLTESATSTLHPHDLLLEAVIRSDVQRIRDLANSGININSRCDDGASVLFNAVLSAKVEVIRTLLELGADPNFKAVEPALTVKAETPLDLALQARNLVNWDKYNPVVLLLIDYGATGYEIKPAKEALMHERALDWQQNGKRWV